MHKTTMKLYGLPIYVGSCLGTRVSVTHKYITMDQDIYDLMIIACAKIEGFADDWIDDQLTRPRDDLFRSLANKDFYYELLGIVRALRRDMLLNTGMREENYAI